MYQKYKNAIWLVAISLITIALFYKVLSFEFLEWNESKLITENHEIQNLSIKNIANYFSDFETDGYYPLAKLNFTFAYKIAQNNPFVFHLLSILLHILNIVLVFYFLKLLFQKFEISIIAALLFAIHPLHVEAVTWISANNILLFTAFSLLSLIFFIQSTENDKKKWYWWSIIFFILALFTKSQAAVLIFGILLIDYYIGREIFTKSNFIKKLPYLVLALIFGVLSFITFYSSRLIEGNALPDYNFFEKITVASYGLILYFVKLIAPIKLSAFYPLPELMNGGLSAIYWIYTLIVLALISTIVYAIKKDKKLVAFGLLFFIVNIIFLLRPEPFTNSLLANKNIYLGSIGIFILVGYGYSLLKNSKLLKIIGGSIFLLYIVLLGFTNFNHSKLWQNSLVFSNEIVRENPEHYLGYKLRGIAFRNDGLYNEALNDFQKALEINPNVSSTIRERGISLLYAGRFDLALQDLNVAVNIDSLSPDNYFNRGLIHNKIGNFKVALNDFSKCIELSKENPEILMNIGNTYLFLNEFDTALENYTKAIELNPNYAEAFASRANLKVNFMTDKSGYKDFKKALELEPENNEVLFLNANALYQNGEYQKAMIEFSKLLLNDTDNATAAYYRGNCKYAMKNFKDAIIDYTLAVELNKNYTDAYVNRGSAYFQLEKYDYSIRDYNTAIEFNPNSSDAFNNRGIAEYHLGKYNEAIQDFSKALQFNNAIPSAYYYRGLSYIKLNRNKIGCRDLEVAQKMEFVDKFNVYNTCN
jgi:protein O-mannosyl-transferase